MKNKYILLLILLLGFMLRTIFVNSSPPSLYGDELTIALDSNSLLKSGRDQLGNFLPLTFEMGAGRPAGYVYGSIPFVAIFGPSALGVRAVSILSGMGIIILLYLLGKRFFSEKTALATAFIGAVSPWEISLSRGGFEAHFALFLALLGTYLFIKAKENPLLYIFSALSFGLTLHTYPTYKVSLLFFLPLLLFFTGVSDKERKNFILSAAVFLLLGFVAFSQTFIGGSEKRFSDINIFSQDKLKETLEQKINLERNLSILPQSISRYFHNKPVEYTKVLIENYLQNFSLDFLVLHGDRNPRHNMATMGEIYFVEIILVAMGMLISWQKYKRVLIFLLVWIMLAPIPTAFVDLPHALRSSFLLPPLLLLSALGLSTALSKKNKIALFMIVLFFIIQFVFFLQKLYFLAPSEYSNFWSYSAKIASDIARENKDKFNYILLSDKINDIEFAYPVYGNIDPTAVISQNKDRAILQDLHLKKFDNVYIGYIPDGEIQRVINGLDGSVFFVGTPDLTDHVANFEVINGGDYLPAIILSRK